MSEFTIQYSISSNEPTNTSQITNATQNGVVTGMQEQSTYYVWAIATKNEKSIRSSNYIKITTGHSHSGSSSSGGGCYTTRCSGGNGYYKYLRDYSVLDSYKVTLSSGRVCGTCGTNVSKGNYMRRGRTTGYTPTIACAKCKKGAFLSKQSGRYAYMCNNCYNNIRSYGTIDFGDGFRWDGSFRWTYSSNDQFVIDKGSTADRLYGASLISHDYSLSCGKSSSNTKSESVEW